MRIIIVTQGDPIFIPLYLKEIIERYSAISAVIELPSFSSTHRMIRRTLDFLGVKGFLILGFKVILIRIANLLAHFGVGCFEKSAAGYLKAKSIPHIKLENVNSLESLKVISDLSPDLIFSLAAPQKFKDALLRIPSFGCYNIHSSLLPKYKGQLALFWALADHESKVGYTIHKMDHEFDHGPIAIQKVIEIEKNCSFEESSLKVIATASQDIAKFFKDLSASRGSISLTKMDESPQFYKYPTARDRRRFVASGRRLFHLRIPTVQKEKLFAVTLDLEPDYAGMKPLNTYYSCDPQRLARFFSILDENAIPLTVFVVGSMLDQSHPIVKVFENRKSIFELHSYSHKIFNADVSEEIRRGKEAFERYFGRSPVGYRTPQGRIFPQDFELLSKHGFLYDSSIFPSFWPSFRFFTANRHPNYLLHSNILEIPFAALPIIRIIISHSWLKLLGPFVWNILLKIFPLPRVLVFDCHLHDFVCPVECESELNSFWRFIFRRNSKITDRLFRDFVNHVLVRGYRPVSLNEVYEQYSRYA